MAPIFCGNHSPAAKKHAAAMKTHQVVLVVPTKGRIDDYNDTSLKTLVEALEKMADVLASDITIRVRQVDTNMLWIEAYLAFTSKARAMACFEEIRPGLAHAGSISTKLGIEVASSAKLSVREIGPFPQHAVPAVNASKEVSTGSKPNASVLIKAVSSAERAPPPMPPPPLADIKANYLNEMREAQGGVPHILWVAPLLIFLTMTGCCIWCASGERPPNKVPGAVAGVAVASPDVLEESNFNVIDESAIEDSQRRLRRPTPRPGPYVLEQNA